MIVQNGVNNSVFQEVVAGTEGFGGEIITAIM